MGSLLVFQGYEQWASCFFKVVFEPTHCQDAALPFQSCLYCLSDLVSFLSELLLAIDRKDLFYAI